MDLSRIFFILREKEKISKEELYACGANDEYIKGAIEDDTLRVEDDYYVVGDIDALVKLGNEMVDKMRYKEAFSIFNCAYAKDFKNYSINLELLYFTLNSQKPKKGRIYKFFDVVYKKLVEDGKEYDANYYLFILGNIYGFYNKDNAEPSNLFEDYKEKFINLEENDILIPGKTNSLENSIRKAVFSNLCPDVDRFARLLFTDDKEDHDLIYLLEKFLVLKWIDNKKFINMKFAEYLFTDKMKAARDLLYKQQDRRSLTKTNEYILKIINSYITIEETGIIPKSKYDGDNILEAINGNNYELALKLEKQRIMENGRKKETNLYVVLKKIVSLIHPKEEVEEVKEEKPLKQVEEPEALPIIKLTPGDIQLIEDRVNKIYGGRMIFLLEPMPHEKRELIRDYLKEKEYNDVFAFSIGSEPNRRLVLKYKPKVTEYVNLKKTLDDAKSFYASRNYDLALEYYELSLKIGKPRASTYGGYGMTLYRLGRDEEALDCLKIANILAEEEGKKDFHFGNIIERIECPVPREDMKPMAVVKESEFEDKNNFLLDDETLNAIIGLSETGDISIEEACTKLGLTPADINYVKLMCAKDCYYLGKYSEGDKYFKQVERSKEKDQKVKELYKDILVNKNYYHNRLDSDKNQLVFIKK